MKLFILCIFFVVSCSSLKKREAKVFVKTLVSGAIQPQAFSKNDRVHLSYYKDKNIYYQFQEDNSSWSLPVRVNNVKDSLTRNGVISHHTMAIGNDNSVHIAWLDTEKGKYLYTKKETSSKKFIKEFSPLTEYIGIEAGPMLVVDKMNNPRLIWAGGDLTKEDKRDIYQLNSKNRGSSFEKLPVKIGVKGAGVCACCGGWANIDTNNRTNVLYRVATKSVNRDITHVSINNNDNSHSSRLVHAWKLNACPVSTCHIGGDIGRWASWETKGEIYFTNLDFPNQIYKVPGTKVQRRKNPWISKNEKILLISWAEGNHWNSGGKLHWIKFNLDRKTFGKIQSPAENTLPKHGRASSVRLKEGDFIIFK